MGLGRSAQSYIQNFWSTDDNTKMDSYFSKIKVTQNCGWEPLGLSGVGFYS